MSGTNKVPFAIPLLTEEKFGMNEKQSDSVILRPRFLRPKDLNRSLRTNYSGCNLEEVTKEVLVSTNH